MGVDMVLEEIDEGECRELLMSHHVGRIGVVLDNGQPLVLPVNYAFDGDRVAIRSDPGSKLTAANLGLVAFEIDGVDDDRRRGWSVLVQGRGYEVTESLDVVSEALRTLPVDPWAPGDKACWIRIDPRTISGRRLG